MSMNIASVEIDITQDGLYLVRFRRTTGPSKDTWLLTKEIAGGTQDIARYLEHFFKAFYEHFKVPLFGEALERFTEQQAETDSME